MSKTVDELVKVFNRAKWDQLRAGDYENLDHAGIVAVIRSLRDEVDCWLASENMYEAAGMVDRRFNQILGDAGAATAGAIQPQGEAENGLRRSIEGPEGRAASGAFGLERQGHVPVSGERINLHREPPTAAGNIPRRDSDRLPAPHRHEDGGQQVRAVVGVTDGPAGRGLGDSSLNEKVAGVARADDLGIEVTGVDRRETVKQIHEQPEADTYDPSAPATAPATDPPPAVCVWTKRGRHEPGFYNTPHGLCHINHLPKSGGCWCGNPIKFTEAK